jgi:adenylate cyclase
MIRLRRIVRRIFGQGRLVALILLLDLLIVRWWDPQPLVAMRFKFFDTFQRWLPRVEATHPVVIVDVDEPSLRRAGPQPVGRHGTPAGAAAERPEKRSDQHPDQRRGLR